MNEAPKGKIGRLPRAIQEQVNRRLENGEKARTLVAWLNAQPEVSAVLAAEFAGQPLREQNLSQWRKYGDKQWLWRRQALAMTQDSPGFGPPPPLSCARDVRVPIRVMLAFSRKTPNHFGMHRGNGGASTFAFQTASRPLIFDGNAMKYSIKARGIHYSFPNLNVLLGRATPLRSGDQLAGTAAASMEERVAAQMCLADVPLTAFLEEPAVPYDEDEVTRLILDTHDRAAFAPVATLTVGEFRDWLLDYATDGPALARLARGLMPEMAAAVSKIMSNQDLILVASKIRVVTRFRNTLGLPGRLSVRLQPNHPTDDLRGITAAILDGLLYGCGDAVIGINPATDNPATCARLLQLVDRLRTEFAIPTQSCVLAHVTTTMRCLERGEPVDLVFQSIAGTENANKSFGVNLARLREAQTMALALRRGTLGDNVMYFETGQGSCLSANAHHGCDQQTLEARAYAVAREFSPLLVNTVVGFIGPEYLFDGKQIIRAGLEDHFCGKLLGLPMGCDVCYTNHAEADQDDMDNLLTLLGVAGCNFIMGVPGADDIMLNYQSTSFHDSHYLRQVLGLRPAPEFAEWLEKLGLLDSQNRLQPAAASGELLTRRVFQQLAPPPA